MIHTDLYDRKMSAHLREASRYYPIISLAGPRQAGKSTLLKKAFSGYEYVSMEDPDVRQFTKADPRGFFDRYREGIIIDEAQRVPELFSYLQTIVDANRAPGRYVISGSQNYLMHRNITQSLAGRVDLSTLYPLDFTEIAEMSDWDTTTEKAILNGFYPGKLGQGIPSKIFYNNYIKTYLERDVSDLVNVGNLTTFRTFLKLIAYKCATQIKMSELSMDLNVSVNTIKTWLTILESSYIITMLPPYHRNYGKRLLKAPRLYFMDTGLLCHLLGIDTEEKLRSSDKYGYIFENMIVAEKIKYKAHRNMDPDMFFFRDSNGFEVDLLEPKSIEKTQMIEIKSGKTFKSEFLGHMRKMNALDPKLLMGIIYDGHEQVSLSDYSLYNWRQVHDL
jgi:uncharacterized protein